MLKIVSEEVAQAVKARKIRGESFDLTLRRLLGLPRLPIPRGFYPFKFMSVGETLFLSTRPDTRERLNAQAALNKATREHGLKFEVHSTPGGMQITRCQA